MAISLTHYQLLKLLKERGELPQGGRILEIGKANWYGDAPVDVVRADLREVRIAKAKEQGAGIYDEGWHTHCAFTGQGQSDAMSGRPGDGPDLFMVARFVYEICFGATDVDAIDSDPNAGDAMKIDLNKPIDFNDNYSAVINHGTAEHVFNIANVFKVMHDACEVGGMMIHESPFTGWTSHGFYSLQPTLFFDVARENGYEMVLVATEHLRSRTFAEWKSHDDILAAKFCDQLSDHLMLFVAMRKVRDEAFRIPTQGIYAASASQFVRQMWGVLR